MEKPAYRFLLAGLITAWTVDFLFYKKPIGISFLIWIGIVVTALLALGYSEKIKPAWPSFILMAFSLVFASTALTRLEPFSVAISVLAALSSIALLAATFHRGHWLWFRLIDYLTQFMVLLAAAFYRAWSHIFPPKNNPDDGENTDNQDTKKKRGIFWPLVRGIVLALPVVAVLAALLAAADPIFENNLKNVLDVFRIENLSEYLFRIFYIGVLAYLFSGSFLHAVYPAKEEEKPDPQTSWLPPFLGNIETSVILASVNILFLSFLSIQFQYFFGGESNINSAGFTYAEYARRGFGELVMVAVLSLALYIVLQTVTKKELKSQRLRFTVLSIGIFLQVLVMLVSSYQRLSLYESAYGFSRLRTYSHLFIPWLAVIILAVIVLEITKKQGRLALAFFLFASGFVITASFSNIDGLIAQRNIARAQISNQEGYALDRYYLAELSNDAVPEILSGYQESTGELRSQLGADLTCRWIEIEKDEQRPWQGFNLSRDRAARLLQEKADEWTRYQPDEDEYGNPILEINGETWHCGYRSEWD